MTELRHPVIAPPRLGQPAPAFTGRSANGAISLSDYRGHWLVFFANPADFAPVCASELVRFAERAAEFRALDCRLLGLSANTTDTHRAWLDALHRDFAVRIDFPILQDPSLRIARAYGMGAVHGTTAERPVVIIDPCGIVRAMLRYPCEAGRSVAEVLRLVRALQMADHEHVATPEGWQSGERAFAFVPPGIQEHLDTSIGCVEWYDYRTQTSPAP